jgi:predicted nucleotidyltransferase component of viral defense system
MTTLLKLALQIQSLFKEFYLAGGTAIMFKYEHRTSIDLDFFRSRAFSYNTVAQTMRKKFEVTAEERMSDNIDFFVEGKRISFVFFPFWNVQPLREIKGLRAASDYDIFLNKIYSAGRRVTPKDPFDAAYLYHLNKWPKRAIKRDFERKFPDQSYELYLGALLSFEDYPGIDAKTRRILSKLL